MCRSFVKTSAPRNLKESNLHLFTAEDNYKKKIIKYKKKRNTSIDKISINNICYLYSFINFKLI